MKKSIILLAVLSASLVSCSKTEETPEVKSGIPVSVNASFSDLTKTSTVADGNVLKSTWDAEESISIITLDALSKGKVVAIDNFTSSGAAGRSSANFSGTFTGGTNPVKVIAVYPALEKVGDTYRTKENYALTSNAAGWRSSILQNIKIGSDNVVTRPEFPFRQEGNGDCNHLKDFCVMVGKVDTKDLKRGKLSASLRHLMMVFKIQVNFANSYKGRHLEEVQIYAYDNAGVSPYQFLCQSSAHVDLDSSPFLGDNGFKADRYFRMPTSFKVPESGFVTFYIPCAPYDRLKAGSNWQIAAKLSGDESVDFGEMIFKKEVVYEAGKMYRINLVKGPDLPLPGFGDGGYL